MGNGKILLVDDEENIRNLVFAYLKTEGYAVICARDGPEAWRLFDEHQPDLVILDVMLPGIDGMTLLDRIRQVSEVYILMLTARGEESDRVLGLTMGADDYLTKPFSPRELVARVQAILRRGRDASRDDPVLCFETLRIDRQRYEVWRGDERISLTAREFKLLDILADHAGMVLSREILIEKVWGHDFYGDDRVVDVHIGHIRSKLEHDPSDPEFIQTVRGVGYKFADKCP